MRGNVCFLSLHVSVLVKGSGRQHKVMIIQSAFSRFHIRRFLFYVQPEEERRRSQLSNNFFTLFSFIPLQVIGTRRGDASQAKTIPLSERLLTVSCCNGDDKRAAGATLFTQKQQQVREAKAKCCTRKETRQGKRWI